MKPLFPLLQPWLPHHLISRAVGAACAIQWPPLKNFLINRVRAAYNIKMDDYLLQDATDFTSFNDFFTRQLRPDARPMDPDATLISPVDGTVSQGGHISADQVFQAKGHQFSVQELLANKDLATLFHNGQFLTLYLAPYNYHRIHMPIAGTLTAMTYIPGRLFSVNAQSVEHIDELFARNERVVAHFDTAAGPLAMIMVGALNVGSIETVDHGVIAPSILREITHWEYQDDEQKHYERGAEFGRFNMGSTVILMHANDELEWQANLAPETPVQLGIALT